MKYQYYVDTIYVHEYDYIGDVEVPVTCGYNRNKDGTVEDFDVIGMGDPAANYVAVFKLLESLRRNPRLGDAIHDTIDWDRQLSIDYGENPPKPDYGDTLVKREVRHLS